MKIAIIGAGKVGSALGTNWARLGYTVIYGVRDVSRADIRELTQRPRTSAAAPREAAAQADVVVLALPWAQAENAVKALGDLSGKVVIDAMNPLGMTPNGFGLERGYTTSGAETVAGWSPGARVVKTLNQVGAEIMADTSVLSSRPVMMMAGNEPEAKAIAAELVTALGFEVLDAGDLTKARLLEPFALVWINQAMMRGHGREWAFGAITKKTLDIRTEETT